MPEQKAKTFKIYRKTEAKKLSIKIDQSEREKNNCGARKNNVKNITSRSTCNFTPKVIHPTHPLDRLIKDLIKEINQQDRLIHQLADTLEKKQTQIRRYEKEFSNNNVEKDKMLNRSIIYFSNYIELERKIKEITKLESDIKLKRKEENSTSRKLVDLETLKQVLDDKCDAIADSRNNGDSPLVQSRAIMIIDTNIDEKVETKKEIGPFSRLRNFFSNMFTCTRA